MRKRVVGRVGDSRVRLWCANPRVRNSFKPIFVGAFHQDGGGVALVGRCTMHPSVKFIGVVWWSGTVLVLGLIAFAMTLPWEGDSRLSLTYPLATMAALGAFHVWLCRFGWRSSAEDIDVMSGVIREALRVKAKPEA